MINLQTVALVAAAIAFLVFVLWQVRPFVGSGQQKPGRALLKEARAKIESAPDDAARALALCDAGDACALSLRGGGEAAQYYLRAMRQLPFSSQIVERAIEGLARKPHALEKVLWRKLGSLSWTGDSKAVTKTALRGLVDLYSGSLHDRMRARALENALQAIE